MKNFLIKNYLLTNYIRRVRVCQMPAIKSIAAIAEKWTRVTPLRTEDYKLGIESPRKDWAEAAGAAEESYKTAVTEAAAEGRFGRGVSKAGTPKWKEKALTKGVPRWGEGVRLACPDYAAGFGPFRDVIEQTTLPPRYPKGDPRNIERVAVLAAALRAKKLAG